MFKVSNTAFENNLPTNGNRKGQLEVLFHITYYLKLKKHRSVTYRIYQKHKQTCNCQCMYGICN